MSIQLETLTSRHLLNKLFSHRVKFLGQDDTVQYIKARLWLNEHYGPGIEREFAWIMDYPNDFEVPDFQWAWFNEDRLGRHYIYLKDSLITHFSLKYLNT